MKENRHRKKQNKAQFKTRWATDGIYCPIKILARPHPESKARDTSSSKPNKTCSMASRAKETTCYLMWTREIIPTQYQEANHKQRKSFTNNPNRWENTSKWLESHNHGQIIIGKLTTIYSWHFIGLGSRWSHPRNDNKTCCSNILGKDTQIRMNWTSVHRSKVDK